MQHSICVVSEDAHSHLKYRSAKKPKATIYVANVMNGAPGGNVPFVESWIASIAAPSGV
jgi:hypothetical protein